MCGHLEIMKYLVERKADVNLLDLNGTPILALAASEGHLEVVKFLVPCPLDRSI